MLCPGKVQNTWWNGRRNRILVNGVVQADFKDHLSFNDATGILTIHNININDTGVYWCGGIDAMHKFHLTVIGKF